jgi:hypothetical protein
VTAIIKMSASLSLNPQLPFKGIISKVFLENISLSFLVPGSFLNLQISIINYESDNMLVNNIPHTLDSWCFWGSFAKLQHF